MPAALARKGGVAILWLWFYKDSAPHGDETEVGFRNYGEACHDWLRFLLLTTMSNLNRCVPWALKLVLVFAVTGCAQIKPLPKETQVRALIVPEAYVVKRGIQKLTLPAGRYQATMEDTSGYYFPAPGKVIGHDFLGNYLLDGGIYRRKEPPCSFSVYHIGTTYQQPCKWKAPPDFNPQEE